MTFHAERAPVPQGSVRAPYLAWHARSTSVCYVSNCRRYEISVHHGRKGARYLCTFFEMQPRRSAGLFALRASLDDSFADAQHHARTGEVRA